MTSYKTPGVYVEEISNFPPSIAEVETAIPAFIGYTEKAQKRVANDLLRIPVRIKSMVEYESLFGTYRPQEISVNIDTNNLPYLANIVNPSNFKMYYALKAYFQNGGKVCNIISVGSYSDNISLSALGKSGSTLQGGLDIVRKTDGITLIYFPDAHALNGVDFYALYEQSLRECGDLKDRFTIIDVKRDGAALADPVAYLRGQNGIGYSDLKYGAAYWPFLKTKLNWGVNNNTITFFHKGGGVLEGTTLSSVLEDESLMPLITDKFLSKMKQEISSLYIEMPPGAFIAGAYARVDAKRGVWKAPANVSLNLVLKPLVNITRAMQGDLNVDATGGKSINAIREFTGRGTMIWGARTLAGNDNEWRYISVRRFFNMVEESIKRSTEWVVFEPNDANTWIKVRSMIGNYLTTKWRDGALAGSTPDHAYYVKVGLNETMTMQDIQTGRMIVEIGMAVIRPAEFTILKINLKMQKA